MKRVIIFRWLLPVVYLATVLIYLTAMVSGAGHIPHSFERLFDVIAAPCYLVDLILPRGSIHNPVFALTLCGISGLLTFAFTGWLIDIALQSFRNRRVPPTASSTEQ
jgi:hypothetical protein